MYSSSFLTLFFFFKATLVAINNAVIIEKNVILERKLFGRQKISFPEVEYLSLRKDKDIEVICVYSNTGTVIKIPKSYQNFEIFEEIIAGQHWRWKK